MSTLKRMPDPYRTLGVPRSADVAQIKAAHRRLAKRHHPDAGGKDEQRFLAVQEAYRLLTDPSRRQEWDRQHGPGPVDARERGQRPRSRTSSARATSARGAAQQTGGRTRRGPTGAPRADVPNDENEPAASWSDRDPASRRHTWSAEGVPWWEDFSPKRRPAGDQDVRPGAGGTAPPPGAPSQRPGMDFEVFNRSSGAAWSSAARRHFRRDDADLPSRGAFRYRGSQVVTGAEARKVAAEEAAATGRHQPTDLFRRGATTPAATRQAFEHDAPASAAPAAPAPAAPAPAPLAPANRSATAQDAAIPRVPSPPPAPTRGEADPASGRGAPSGATDSEATASSLRTRGSRLLARGSRLLARGRSGPRIAP